METLLSIFADRNDLLLLKGFYKLNRDTYQICNSKGMISNISRINKIHNHPLTFNEFLCIIDTRCYSTKDRFLIALRFEFTSLLKLVISTLGAESHGFLSDDAINTMYQYNNCNCTKTYTCDDCLRLKEYKETCYFRVTEWLRRISIKQPFSFRELIAEIIDECDIYAAAYVRKNFGITWNSTINKMAEEHSQATVYYQKLSSVHLPRTCFYFG